MNIIIERLIDAGHSEAATIAEWKDGLNEMWADLLELIDTRMQLLAASYDLHRYFYTGTEILGLIDEKHRELPEDVGLDASTAESFHRVHTAFERELHLLGLQVLSVPCCSPTPPPPPQLLGPAIHLFPVTNFPGAWGCQPLEWTPGNFASLERQQLGAKRLGAVAFNHSLASEVVLQSETSQKPRAQNTLKCSVSGCAAVLLVNTHGAFLAPRAGIGITFSH